MGPDVCNYKYNISSMRDCNNWKDFYDWFQDNKLLGIKGVTMWQIQNCEAGYQELF